MLCRTAGLSVLAALSYQATEIRYHPMGCVEPPEDIIMKMEMWRLLNTWRVSHPLLVPVGTWPTGQAPEILVPHLKGLVKPVTPCVYPQNAEIFLTIFCGPPNWQGLCHHF